MTNDATERIPLSVPNITGREAEYVQRALEDGWVSSSGPDVGGFEAEFASAVGAHHAVAVSSGTAALHLSLLTSGIRPGDEVLMPSLTFIAPANAVRYLGAHPTFVDVDPDHWQVDVDEIERFLDHACVTDDGALVNRHTGRRVRAILPVDILGHPADLDAIAGIAADHDLVLIEDATESLGALYRGTRVGGGAHPACFSFNGNKLITTGGGGMVTTNDADVAARIRHLSTQAKDDELRYRHSEIGFNYRLTNVQAAIGRAQLERLDEFVVIKRAIAARYRNAFADHPGVTLQAEAPWATSSFWLSTVVLPSAVTGGDPATVSEVLERSGIQTRPLWEPLHQSAAHRDSFHAPCPTSEAVHATALSLPCSTSLRESEQDRVIEAIVELVG